ncbi:MAG TPA: YetF domain-containing protein [Terriglobia bacterium]|nr:YetF domain-containing protein [Terriglobia bacterium]
MHVNIWRDMFLPGLPVIDKILRAVIVYAFLVVALKLAGRRELAQLNTFDLVVLLMIANTVQNATIGNDNSITGGLIGVTTLLVANYLVARFIYVHKKAQGSKDDDGEVLIEKGKIQEAPLKKEMITMDDLKEAANRQGFKSLDEVERATLNQDGSFAFVKKSKEQAGRHEYREILSRIDHLADLVGRMQPGEGPAGR